MNNRAIVKQNYLCTIEGEENVQSFKMGESITFILKNDEYIVTHNQKQYLFKKRTFNKVFDILLND